MIETDVVVSSGMKLVCSRDELGAKLAVVARAVSARTAVQILSGILLRAEGSELQLAATDMELSVRETPVSGDLPELEAIIPARALAELTRIAGGEGELELGIQENQVLFGVDGIWLATRRIDGQFPNYKQLLPETFEHELTLPRPELLEVVRRVAVLAQRNSPLRLRFAEGELTVSARTQDVGEASESLPVSYTGDPLEIGFNAEFLRDGIDSVVGDELVLKLISPLRPAVMTSPGDDFTYLIMPIRLAG